MNEPTQEVEDLYSMSKIYIGERLLQLVLEKLEIPMQNGIKTTSLILNKFQFKLDH